MEKKNNVFSETDLIKYASNGLDKNVCDIIKGNPKLLFKLPKNTRKEEYILSAITNDIHIFDLLDDDEKSMKICELAVKDIPGYIKEVPEKIRTEEFILKMIGKRGFVIGYIDNPTEEMCLLAVKSTPYAIYDIKNPTEEMLLIAIENGEGVIFSIPNPTEKMMSIALKTQGLYNKWRNMPQYYNAVLLYMKKYGQSLKHIRRKYKTYEVCKAAIDNSPYAIKYVNKSTLKKHPDLLELSLKKWGK